MQLIQQHFPSFHPVPSAETATTTTTTMRQNSRRSKRKGKQLAEGFEPDGVHVICGRGKQSYNHPGNRRYRLMIAMHMHSYSKAPTKLDKSLIVISVVNAFRSVNGGFVRRHGNGNWVDIGDTLAREKTGHAIRDAINARIADRQPIDGTFAELVSVNQLMSMNGDNLEDLEQQVKMGRLRNNPALARLLARAAAAQQVAAVAAAAAAQQQQQLPSRSSSPDVVASVAAATAAAMPIGVSSSSASGETITMKSSSAVARRRHANRNHHQQANRLAQHLQQQQLEQEQQQQLFNQATLNRFLMGGLMNSGTFSSPAPAASAFSAVPMLPSSLQNNPQQEQQQQGDINNNNNNDLLLSSFRSSGLLGGEDWLANPPFHMVESAEINNNNISRANAATARTPWDFVMDALSGGEEDGAADESVASSTASV